MKRAIAAVLIVTAMIAALATALLGYSGYFGGRQFIPVAATAPARDDERGLAVVYLSGDLGFTLGLGQPIVERIAAHGLPVIEVNSLIYFRTSRTPAEARTLVTAAIGHALDLPGIDRVAVIGQSFGADILQRSLAGLTPAERAPIAMVGLIVPGDTVDYQAIPGGVWRPPARSLPAWPTARTLTWVPAICIQGREETESLCPRMTMANVSRVTLPGGHLLDHDPIRAAAELIAAIDRMASTLPKVQTPPTARPSADR